MKSFKEAIRQWGIRSNYFDNKYNDVAISFQKMMDKLYDVQDLSEIKIKLDNSRSGNNFATGGYMTDPTFGDFQSGVYAGGGSVGDVSGNYYSTTDFVSQNDLMDLAKSTFGQDWESGGDYDYDTEEIKMLVKKLGGGYKIVYVDSEQREKFENAKSKYLPLLKNKSNDGDIFVIPNKKMAEGGFTPDVSDGTQFMSGVYAKGGKLESKIQKKVDEVNSLIEKAIDKDGNTIMVVDKSGTWEEPMIYKPISYRNGRLYIEYYEPYSDKTKKEVVNKSNIDFDGYPMLLDIAKMYRRALKEKGVSYAGGGKTGKLSFDDWMKKNNIEVYKRTYYWVADDGKGDYLYSGTKAEVMKSLREDYKKSYEGGGKTTNNEPREGDLITNIGTYGSRITKVADSYVEFYDNRAMKTVVCKKSDLVLNNLDDDGDDDGFYEDEPNSWICKKSYEGGGKTTFKEKATAIAKNFEGKKVEPKYQKEYGKTYDKAEAKEVGNKIAGSQKAKYDSKMSGGGKTKRGGAMLLAKQIRKDGESWQSALKRANEQMRNK